jgi:hypothetical protein
MSDEGGQLSPYGKSLLKALGGDLGMVRATPHAVKRWGADQPESILHVLPPELQARILALPPEILELSENELVAALPGGLTRQDRRLRINFWAEYERAQRAQEGMNLSTVVLDTGLPSWGVYEQRLYQMPALLAWLMQPPPSYQLQIKEAHELGISRLMEILALPLTMTDGKGNPKINVGVGLLILQAIKLVDNRRMGAPTQKNVQVNVDAGKAPEGATLSMEQIDRRIEELENNLGLKAEYRTIESSPPGKKEEHSSDDEDHDSPG